MKDKSISVPRCRVPHSSFDYLGNAVEAFVRQPIGALSRGGHGIVEPFREKELF
jgi:hypothetical protein